MDDYLRDIVQLSLGSAPEEMLKKSLDTCVQLSGAAGGSILGEEGPYLQFLFSDVSELIGVRVPMDSIAGVTVNRSMVVYTYAPADKRHYGGVDDKIRNLTKYLLSIPIPSIYKNADTERQARNAGALQLLFTENLLPELPVENGPQEFLVDTFKESPFYTGRLKSIFWLLPIVAFGLEVMRLRQTSYQAIHELKNKLISGLSWIGYLKNDIREKSPGLLNDENIMGDFELAQTSIREGAELAKIYLQLTRIYNPKFLPLNINEVIGETALSVRALAAEMNVSNFRLSLRYDDRMEKRNLDAGQLKMAFFNLCKNSVEALVKCEVMEPTVTIESALTEGKISIVFADNGPGMPMEIADNLFVPFKTKKEGGTGLGLTITKKIIDIHGGIIKCETGPSGTTFRITM